MQLLRVLVLSAAVAAFSSGFCHAHSGESHIKPVLVDTFHAAATDFADFVSNEMLQLKEGVTLGEWQTLHPNDSLVRYGYEWEEVMNNDWCIRADKHYVLPSGKTANRRVYFYAPPPRPDLMLPELADSLHVRMTEPVLGMILIQLADTSRYSGENIADSVRFRLSQVFGRGEVDRKLWGFGSAGWTHTCRWQTKSAILATAYGVNPNYGHERMVLAYGFLPISNVHVDLDHGNYSPGGQTVDIDSLIFWKTIQLLGKYRENASELVRTYSMVRRSFGYSPHVTFPKARTSIAIRDVTARFRNWFHLTSSADTQTRAAALVLADQVVRQIAGILDDTDSLVISEFQQLGASIRQSRTMGWIYESTWANEACSLAPQSPASDLAIVLMMQRGFQLDAGITDCGRCFVRIIREGENLLTHASDKDVRTWTHFKLGYAYRDVIAIANGYPTLTEEDTSFQMKVDVARNKSVEHFKEAFLADNISVAARSAWRDAWRLTAAIPPQETSFTFVDE